MTLSIARDLEEKVPFSSILGRPEKFAEFVQQIFENPMLNGETIRFDSGIHMLAK